MKGSGLLGRKTFLVTFSPKRIQTQLNVFTYRLVDAEQTSFQVATRIDRRWCVHMSSVVACVRIDWVDGDIFVCRDQASRRTDIFRSGVVFSSRPSSIGGGDVTTPADHQAALQARM